MMVDGLLQPDVAQDTGAIFVDVADERSGRLAVRDDLAEVQPGFTTSADRPYISI